VNNPFWSTNIEEARKKLHGYKRSSLFCRVFGYSWTRTKDTAEGLSFTPVLQVYYNEVTIATAATLVPVTQ